MKRVVIILLLLLAGIAWCNSIPAVENFMVGQRQDGSQMIDVFYDVYDADGDVLTASMEVSEDDGTTWTVSCDSLSGDVGDNIIPGTGKQIVWNFGAEHPGTFGDNYKVRLHIDDHYVEQIEGMILVEGGTFDMGDHFDEGYYDELPVHEVTLNSFLIGQYEVTHTNYIEFLNSWGVSSDGSYNGTELINMDDSDCAIDYNGSFYFGGSSRAPNIECPVIEVTWYGGIVYCNWLSEQEGLTPCYDLSDWSCDFSADGYRLPTEAEWEYAARGGVNWTDNYRYSGTTDNMGDYGWYSSNSGSQTHEVGTKEPNQLSIYDMSGNVYEWCNDWYCWWYYSSSPGNNPTGPDSGTPRVRRGGSWNLDAGGCSVANRSSHSPGGSSFNIGFRILRAVE